MKAVILANQANKKSLPTPMEMVGDKTIIERQLLSLKNSGVTDVLIILSSATEMIKNHLGDGNSLGMNLSYHVEKSPLGTAGCFAYIASQIHEDFIFLFANWMLDIAWERIIEFHQKSNAMMTAYVHPVPHPEEADMLLLGNNNIILNILDKKQKRDFYFENVALTGAYIVSESLIETFEDMEDEFKMDFHQEVLIPTICCEGMYAYRGAEYVLDCSSSSKLEMARRDEKRGIIAMKNAKTLQKAIFLDRDGVINVFGDYIVKAEMLKLKPDVGEAIRLVNESGYLAIVITNQPVIARGDTTFAEMRNIHMRMEDLIGAEGGYLDGIYFCPHYPKSGDPGEVPELKVECDCRKPKIGMLLKAKERFNIDLSASWFVGDHYRDVQTGMNAGCHTVHITSGDQNYVGRFTEAKPEYVCEDLLAAVKLILSK